MLPARSSPPRLKAVLALAGNSRCFDCRMNTQADPWVSVTHGTVLCIGCAGLHRSFGVHISFVRSLALDFLKESELRMLETGGNDRFDTFLHQEARLSRDAWQAILPLQRYSNPAADLYRRRLKALSTGMSTSDLPADLRADAATADPTADPAADPAADSRAPLPPLSRDDLANRAQWTKDSDATRCELCQKKFSLLHRRHHCRRCGRCVCADCSPRESRFATGPAPPPPPPPPLPPLIAHPLPPTPGGHCHTKHSRSRSGTVALACRPRVGEYQALPRKVYCLISSSIKSSQSSSQVVK